MEKGVRLIIVILFVVMILVSIVGGVLYFTTDMLKSNETLFQKYLAQNIKNFANIADVSNEEKNIDYLRKNDYTTPPNHQSLSTPHCVRPSSNPRPHSYDHHRTCALRYKHSVPARLA